MRRAGAPWLSLGLGAWSLGLEAAAVMTQRSLLLAAGGAPAVTEAQRMVAEKIDAALSLQAKAVRGELGVTPASVSARTLAHYRRKVRANRRRLARA